MIDSVTVAIKPKQAILVLIWKGFVIGRNRTRQPVLARNEIIGEVGNQLGGDSSASRTRIACQ